MSGPARRRQRSARVLVACALLAAAVLTVAGAVVSDSWPVLAGAAALGVLLGGTATRITYNEVLQTRRDAAIDRAAQAQAYRALTEERVGEHAVFAADMTGRIRRHEASIGRLEKRLAEVTAELLEAHRQQQEAQDRAQRADDENTRLAGRLEDAEERVAVASLRITELEQERDVLMAEWQAAEAIRKHA